MTNTHKRASQLKNRSKLVLLKNICAFLAGLILTNQGMSQSQLEPSPVYEKAANSLRNAPIKEYDFNRASVRDVLRFLADDAGIDFVALPEDGNDTAKLITFSLNKSPFAALETIAKMNGVSLIYEDEVWHMRPLSDKSLIARTYRMRFNTGEISKGSNNNTGNVRSNGFGSSSNSSTGGTYGRGSNANSPMSGNGGTGQLGLNGTSSPFSTSADELVTAIKGIVGINTAGMNAIIAPGDNSVGNFGNLNYQSTLTKIDPAQNIIRRSAQSSRTNNSQVIWNSDNNSLFVIANRQQHQLVEKYLETVDRPQPLIAVEVKFFETTKDPRKQMGVDWSGTMDGGYGLSLSDLSTNVNLNKINSTDMPMTAILSAPDVQAKVLALVKDRETTTVSYPRVLTKIIVKLRFKALSISPFSRHNQALRQA